MQLDSFVQNDFYDRRLFQQTLLNDLNKDDLWRNVFGVPDKNKKDQEVILRFLDLYFDGENYKPSMKEFLNRYMSKNRNLKYQSRQKICNIFIQTLTIINESLGNKAFRQSKGFTPTFFEAVMVGMARRLAKGNIQSINEFKECYQRLLNNQNFLAVSIKIRDLTNEYNVKERLNLATQAFADLK